MKQKSLAHNISGGSLVSHPRGVGDSVKQKSMAHNISGGLPVGWLVVLRLNVPVNNFSVMSGRSHRFLGN